MYTVYMYISSVMFNQRGRGGCVSLSHTTNKWWMEGWWRDGGGTEDGFRIDVGVMIDRGWDRGRRNRTKTFKSTTCFYIEGLIVYVITECDEIGNAVRRLKHKLVINVVLSVTFCRSVTSTSTTLCSYFNKYYIEDWLLQ